MKNYIFILAILLISCKKEEIKPDKTISVSLNEAEVPGLIPSLTYYWDEYHLSAHTPDEIYEFEIDFPDGLTPTTYSTPQIIGDKDPVYFKRGPITYVFTDSSSFSISITEGNGLYSGSFSGVLHNSSEGSLSVQGEFTNL